MSEKGEVTRQRIIKAAEGLVLKHGFAGTSLEDVLRETGLTKGAFFHHFKSKAELGRAIAESYAEADMKMFVDWSAQADRLSDDPYERVMIFLRLLEQFLDGLTEPPPGCVLASYVYASGMFEPAVRQYVRDRLQWWQDLYEKKFQALIDARPPAAPATARALAEMIASIIQGAFVLGMAFKDRELMKRQSQQFRQYLELLFRPKPI
jgi:TetR/AcrR family transcriptional repressor of nem operon